MRRSRQSSVGDALRRRLWTTCLFFAGDGLQPVARRRRSFCRERVAIEVEDEADRQSAFSCPAVVGTRNRSEIGSIESAGEHEIPDTQARGANVGILVPPSK